MASKKVVKLINDQIAMEADSSAIYLAMATWAVKNGYKGTAAFMFKQAEEEREHMYKFIHFLGEIGEQAIISKVTEPKADYRGLLEVMQTTLGHEKKVTASIHNIMSVARKEDDYPVTSFLKWFIDEQVEEEATANELIDIVKMAGKVSEYLADKEIGAKAAKKD
ncbi:MAG: ferritin [Elusimicrobia bacterium]|nr:ferritin [Elusimicrobiota bacterium]